MPHTHRTTTMIKRRHATGASAANNGSGTPSHSPRGAVLESAGAAVGESDGSVKRTRKHKKSTSPMTVAFFLFIIVCLALIIGRTIKPRSFKNPEGKDGAGTVRRREAEPRTSVSVSASATQQQPPPPEFYATIKAIRKRFEERYGGADAAHGMFKRGIRSFTEGSDKEGVSHTAHRILRAAASADRKFIASFGGYSVTVARGNFFNQSYPFVMGSILKEPLKQIGVDLEVRNAAIGGIPSFPYGWCLQNFLGEDSDLISWDYSMNEGNDAVGLEAYIRQALMMLPKRPLIVVLDNKRPRMELLKKYVKLGALKDPVAILRGDTVVDKSLLSRKEEERPEGLQRWDEWGAPKGSPGQSSWHPKFREHEMMGWLLAMHMIDAIEAAGNIMTKDSDWKDKYSNHETSREGERFQLPALQLPSKNSIIDGHHVSCRTSFLPIRSTDRSLSSIIVSGATEDDGDAMKSKDDDKYGAGWVIDVGKVERDTKRKVEKKGGMGYIDMKTAFYGISASGTLKLWLEYEGGKRTSIGNDMSAKMYYNTIIVCEVNEKRGNKECKMDLDIQFRVGGFESKDVKKVKSLASYLKKEICVSIPIPDDAQLVRRKDVEEATDGLHGNVKNMGNENDVGLYLEAKIVNKAVSRQDGACSISHVVWSSV